MRKIITSIIGLLLLISFFLAGCSANYHAKRVQHHLQKAKAKGLDISKDTVYVEQRILLPGDTITETIDNTIQDTVVIEKERAVLRYYPTPEGIGVDCYCKDLDTLIFNPVITETVTVEVTPKWFKRFKWVLIIAVAGLLVALVLRFIK